ncbi:FoF1 ATP synthase subunit delta [Luteolibacter sp. AS25]|uniref:F0F1 ATP synthase subunit delta n=1 Tax=Luteolibacter sp. AS25 TaxID=3135776 RepID=UPI00398AD163
MKISKVAAATARRLFGLCQVNGQLDENKLRDLVSKIIAAQPRDYQAILAAIHRLTRIDAKSREVTVQSAAELDSASRARVESGLVKDYGNNLSISYTTNPELLGGLKIQVGDDVFDGSVQGRLDRLSKAF